TAALEEEVAPKFQSTPTYSGRLLRSEMTVCSTSFNPRPRIVGDGRRDGAKTSKGGFQSTPTYSGRHGRCAAWNCRLTFQSTPMYSGRRFPAFAFCSIRRFQSTPTYSGRLVAATLDLPVDKFQSTPTYSGRHRRPKGDSRNQCVSIHAHV